MFFQNNLFDLEECLEFLEQKVRAYEVKSGGNKKIRPSALGRFIEIYDIYTCYKTTLSELNRAIEEPSDAHSAIDLQGTYNGLTDFETQFKQILLSNAPNGSTNPKTGVEVIIQSFEKYEIAIAERNLAIEFLSEAIPANDEGLVNYLEEGKKRHEATINEIEIFLFSLPLPPLPKIREKTTGLEQSPLDNDEGLKEQLYGLNEAEVNGVIKLISEHRMDYTRRFLHEKGFEVKSHWSKDALRDYLVQCLNANHGPRIYPMDIVKLLNKIESWGQQQVYLYKLKEEHYTNLNHWFDEKTIMAHLDKLGFSDLFNNTRPIFIPEQRVLTSIEWTKYRVRFTWIEKQFLEHKLEEINLSQEEEHRLWWLRERLQKEGTILRIYTQQPLRCLSAFEWDFTTGEAMLLIQNLKTGTNQSQLREEICHDLSSVLDMTCFSPVQVSRSIRAIELQASSQERLRKKLRHEKPDGAKGTFTSGYNDDVYTSLEPSIRALGDNVVSLEGVFIWLPQGNDLSKAITTKIVRRNQCVEILYQQTEEDVRYVLRRIRSYCPE